MKKIYILSYADSLGTRTEVKECINNIDIIETWRYDMPNSFYLISEHNSKDIGKAIREKINKGRFLISEIGENYYGWLPDESWHLIKYKSHKSSD